MSDHGQAEAVQERIQDPEAWRILKDLDIDTALVVAASRGIIFDSRASVELAIHEMRLQFPEGFTEWQLKQSSEWLEANTARINLEIASRCAN